VAGGHVRCAEEAPTARDRCGPRAAFDALARRCVPFADERGEVDPARWVRALYGADGGAGSHELCARVAVDPSAYGLSAGASAVVSVTIDVVFPDNDVTRVRAIARASVSAPGGARPLPAAANALVQRAVTAPAELLRVSGGTSRAASVTARIECVVHGGSPPIVRGL
jgi:hypothetical protein